VHLSRFDEKRPLLQRLAGRFERKRGRVLPLRLIHGGPVAYPFPASSGQALPRFPRRSILPAALQTWRRPLQTAQTPFFSGQRALHLTELALALNEGVGTLQAALALLADGNATRVIVRRAALRARYR
jgi:hypothetical protein